MQDAQRWPKQLQGRDRVLALRAWNAFLDRATEFTYNGGERNLVDDVLKSGKRPEGQRLLNDAFRFKDQIFCGKEARA